MDQQNKRANAEYALLKARVQTRDERGKINGMIGTLMPAIWQRGYGHSWGTRDEWTRLVAEHPEVLLLSLEKAIDTILSNLAEWSPDLAVKEAKAKAAYVSPADRARIKERMSQLLGAAINKRTIGPPEAGVFICNFDPTRAPGASPEKWGIVVAEMILSICDDETAAEARANAAVQRVIAFRSAARPPETTG